MKYLNHIDTIRMESSIMCIKRSLIWTGSPVAQWYSAWLKTEGLQVQVSPESLRCVLEQDTLILA